MSRSLKYLISLSILAANCFFSAGEAAAICRSMPLNPITDICWQCMFPARFGGSQFGREGDVAPGGTEPPLCGCLNGSATTAGMLVGFWEHARMIETVKDPFCMPSIGSSLNSEGTLSALMAGSSKTSHSSDTDSDYANQQVHYYIFPLWTLLNLFSDFPCVEKKPFDLFALTEVDPLWNDDALSFILNPEALLFGNPITQLSCSADTVIASASTPIDELFWCSGAWGSAYPLNGSSTVTNPLNLNAGMAGKMIYKLGREGLMWDTAVDSCAPDGTLAPIWTKSHYRLQIAKPRRGNDCVPIGRPDFLWGSGKNPPLGIGVNAPDNFLWILTRARLCCVGYTFK